MGEKRQNRTFKERSEDTNASVGNHLRRERGFEQTYVRDSNTNVQHQDRPEFRPRCQPYASLDLLERHRQ